jgi:hypothetical protein
MAALTAVLSVGLFNQARALKCYQAPLSWGSCWTDPNAGVFVFSVYLVYSSAYSTQRIKLDVARWEPLFQLLRVY